MARIPQWVAKGTLVAYTALGGQKVASAQTQKPPTGDANTNPARPQAAAPVHHFQVPAGRLLDVVPMFESASGLHLVLANAAIAEVQSPGVTGDYTNEQAFTHLLEGTSLSFSLTSPGVATLSLSATQQSVTVNAHNIDVYADPPAFSKPIAPSSSALLNRS